MLYYFFPTIFVLNFILSPLSEIVEPLFGRYNFIYQNTQYIVVVISFLLTLTNLFRYKIKYKDSFFVVLSLFISLLFFREILNPSDTSIYILFAFLSFFYFFYFGYSIPTKYISTECFSRSFSVAFCLLLGFSLLYFVLFYLGLLNRVGFSNPIGMVYSFFFFKSPSIYNLMLCVLLFLSAGKRSEIISITILFGYFLFSRPRYSLIAFFSALLVILIFASSGFLDRWIIEDWNDLNSITSGRIYEINYVLDLIISEPSSIFFGLSNSSIAKFTYEFNKSTVHNGVFFLVIHFGVFVSSALLYLFARCIFYDIKRYGFNFINFYCLIYLISMALSTAFISNILFPIFLGVLYSNRSNKVT